MQIVQKFSNQSLQDFQPSLMPFKPSRRSNASVAMRRAAGLCSFRDRFGQQLDGDGPVRYLRSLFHRPGDLRPPGGGLPDLVVNGGVAEISPAGLAAAIGLSNSSRRGMLIDR